jgi:arylsulfatase A-like enzyme
VTKAARLRLKWVSDAIAYSKEIEMAKAGKPNILILWGDDIGWWNISYNNRGQMGYWTPNIDRIGNEGATFTDYYGQQSCTAGRAAFITGQNPIRTGLTKVGVPGAKTGIRAEDPTIAELLKPLGYATGQFGKNHLGERDEFLPTVHGFDEFFGNLYHLNAEEEPEDPDYPKDPEFKKNFGPRGVLHSWSDGSEQKIEDTGALTKKRMETIDDEVSEHALNFIDKTHKEGKPFFVWYNTSGMHFRTHCAEKHKGKSGQGDYNDVMVAHDENIDRMLDKLDELGIADDTIVIYSTDNGPHYNAWPDAGITPFRSEKNTNWEGGWRVPFFVRWPGKIKPGSVFNDLASHQDWLPTFLAAAGEAEITEKLLKGHAIGDKTYRVHIDGYNLLPYLTGGVKTSPRTFFYYISDDGGRLENGADGTESKTNDVLGRTICEAAGTDVQFAA